MTVITVTLVSPIYASCLVQFKMVQIIGTTEKAGYPASSWTDIYSLSFANASTMLIASTGDSLG